MNYEEIGGIRVVKKSKYLGLKIDNDRDICKKSKKKNQEKN